MQKAAEIWMFLAILPFSSCSDANGRSPSAGAHPLDLSGIDNPDFSDTSALDKPDAEVLPPSAEDEDDAETAETDKTGGNSWSSDKNKGKSADEKSGVKPPKDDSTGKKIAADSVKSWWSGHLSPSILAKKCPRYHDSPREMTIENYAVYELETLGAAEFRVTPDDLGLCEAAAAADGAEILSYQDDRLTVFYPQRMEAFIDAAQERIDEKPVEGRWSEPLKRIIPGVSGRSLDRRATYAAFLEAVKSGADAFRLVINEKKPLSEDVSSVADFKPTVLIGEYKTQFSRKKNRTINVKLAASSLDGIFLMPGAEFSYNDWVGERTEARGFKEAPVIENGEMVEGLGGGACQVSSTVHAAALMSGLAIVERYNHSLPSSYIGKGLDAVVSYPILDLRVKNDTQRPVVMRVQTQDNILEVRFYSDVPRREKVRFVSEIAAEIPFEEEVAVDPTLEPQSYKITRAGKVGYKVVRAREFESDGKKRKEPLLMDVYQPRTQLVSVAPDAVYPPADAGESM